MDIMDKNKMELEFKFNLPAIILGDNINTDQLHSPSNFGIDTQQLRCRYLNGASKKILKEASKNTLKNPNTLSNDAGGLIIIAGNNFGIGSSRFSTVLALKNEGVKCVIALSLARIFERNLAAAGIFAFTPEYKTDLSAPIFNQINKTNPRQNSETDTYKNETINFFKKVKNINEKNSESLTAVIEIFKSRSYIIKPDENNITEMKAGIKTNGCDKEIKALIKVMAADNGTPIKLSLSTAPYLYCVAAAGGMVNYVIEKQKYIL